MSSRTKGLRDIHPDDVRNREQLQESLRLLHKATAVPNRVLIETHGVRSRVLENILTWNINTVQKWANAFGWNLRWRFEGFDLPAELTEDFDWSLSNDDQCLELRHRIRKVRKALHLDSIQVDVVVGQARGLTSRWEIHRSPIVVMAAAQRLVRAMGGRLVFYLEPGHNAPIATRKLRKLSS